MRFVIFTGGKLRKGNFVYDALKKAERIIAADSGADTAIHFNCFPDTVVGDMDSISEDSFQKLRLEKVTYITSPAEKDEIDTQLAIQYAIEESATEIFLLGGLSTDRIDHSLANISLTYHPTVSIKLINGNTMSWAVEGPAAVNLKGEENDLLSLIPLSKEVAHIKTEGLCYPLLDESLYFGIPRGISNVFAENHASVSFEEGLLLFVHISVT